MTRLAVTNPFGAPVYHEAVVASTMDTARVLAARGEPHGTVIAADVQEAGRGRVRGRPWRTDPGDSLAFTILLRHNGLGTLPEALTLRTGLAVALALADSFPALSGRLKIKWPNDVMITGGGGGDGAVSDLAAGKAAGILTEADGSLVYIGIGVNLAQRGFPQDWRTRAASVALALGTPVDPAVRFALLDRVLARLHAELFGDGELSGAAAGSGAGGGGGGDTGKKTWRQRLDDRLYLRGRRVRFLAGGALAPELVTGTLDGVGPGGEILIDGRGYVTGELDTRGAV